MKTENGPRKDRKPVTTWLCPDLVRRLKVLAANTGRRQQELITEALGDLLQKYEKARH